MFILCKDSYKVRCSIVNWDFVNRMVIVRIYNYFIYVFS